MSERLSPMMEALKQVRNTPSTVRDALAGRDKRLREEMKTKNPSTPARCDELKTVAHRAKYKTELEHQWIYYKFADPGRFDPMKYEEQALVTRQNAEEVIAAKDARIAELEKLLGLAQSVHRWSVDDHGNGVLYVCKGDHDKSETCKWGTFVPIERVHAFEADNKRLREALERIKMDAKDRSEKSWYRLEMIADEARAALGEVKP